MRWKIFRKVSAAKNELPVPLSYRVLDRLEALVVWAMYTTYPWRTGRLIHDQLLPSRSGAPKVKVLASYPRNYRVRWEINAHMNARNRAHQIQAARQWETLMRTLRANGVEIHEIKQGDGLHDMVFTANAGVVDPVHALFIPAHFAHPQRQPETALFRQYFHAQGYTIDDRANGSLWEGEGDTLVHEDINRGVVRFGGWSSRKGFRSDLEPQRAVAQRLGQRFVGLELVDPRFYHLDTCFFPLGDGKSALYYPGAFTKESRGLIQKNVANPLAIDEADAVAFACNGIVINHVVVINKATPHLKRRLQGEGFTVVETPTTEFLKAGGSVKCLLLLLNGWLISSTHSSPEIPRNTSTPSQSPALRINRAFLTSV